MARGDADPGEGWYQWVSGGKTRKAGKKVIVIELGSVSSLPGHRAEEAWAGKAIDKNPLSAFSVARQLSKAFPGDSLPVQVSSGC